MTAEQASAHPWFALHCIPAEAAMHGGGFRGQYGAGAANNIVPAEDMAARALMRRSASSDDFAFSRTA